MAEFIITKKEAMDLLVCTDDQSLSMKHPQHHEAYHAKLGARSEARFLYIEGAKIAEFFCQAEKNDCHVLDLGLGLGYNAVATIQTWLKSPGSKNLHLVSLEIDSALVTSLLSTKAPWQKNWPEEELALLEQVKKQDDRYLLELSHPQGSSRLHWQIFVGDALELIAKWQNQAKFDFVWQDAFSPTHCPSLWQKEWFFKLHSSCASQAILMTYSVAGVVKNALIEAGWHIEKIKGVGSKRQWLKAYASRKT